ncbi:GtrA family protein [Olleya sp. HaHaR_3_96]|uniref:GtrA family protein n=1 Tax=Olleya sp. HaHaR_3_96 TaxID=2745560 RepID=UPI001C4F10E5|nr:GtrA family protein [Olleya sp. HaHaR_3_96]QXP61156.1 GtrA family protein [Olleya sp. HaHaR_3_96]
MNLITLYKGSQYFRILIVAIIGAAFSFFTYEIIFYLNPFSPRATISWSVAFVIGVARQHALHRYFSFQDKRAYFISLYRAYVVDFSGLVFSAALSWFLSQILQFNYRLTWLCCLLSTAVISLVFLKRFVFKSESAA